MTETNVAFFNISANSEGILIGVYMINLKTPSTQGGLDSDPLYK